MKIEDARKLIVEARKIADSPSRWQVFSEEHRTDVPSLCDAFEKALEENEILEKFRASWQESSQQAQREPYEQLVRADAAEAKLTALLEENEGLRSEVKALAKDNSYQQDRAEAAEAKLSKALKVVEAAKKSGHAGRYKVKDGCLICAALAAYEAEK